MIKKSLSVYLDFLRFGAAVVVLLSHFAYERFTGGRYLWIRDYNLGSDAVVVFFVLSGLVIALTARDKDKTLGRFAFNRATRLISVAAPAVVVTFVLDRIGATANPLAYSGWWYNPLDLGPMLASGLSFSSEWAGQGIRLGTNGPFWSLSYEVAYYVLFGLAVYLRGPLRVVLLAVSTLAFGVNVMILLPAWLAGVWLFRRLQAPLGSLERRAAMLAVGPLVAYALMLAAGVPAFLTGVTESLTSTATIDSLRFSDEFLWNWLLAGCFTVHLLGMATWLGDRKPVAESAIRWLAGASFSLYLVHYPALQFLRTVIPESGVGVVDDAILLVLTMAICLVFAELFERRLKPFRTIVRTVLRRPEDAGLTAAPRRGQETSVATG